MASVELVGIVNVTPDSFSDGGKYENVEHALQHARRLMIDGATLLDVGAESTRPGATPLTDDEEWERLEPVLGALINEFPDSISIDTYHPQTVRRALTLGKFIINDVTCFSNPDMITVAAESGMKCIVSHMPEKFGTDIQSAHSEKPVVSVDIVRDELMKRREQMIDWGISSDNIILDPGIGFGKTPEVNYQLLEFAKYVSGIDVMIGYSRKRFLGENRMSLEPNLAAGRIAAASGARYLRVHDVAGHRPLIAK